MRPAHRPPRCDRECPLNTARNRCLLHAGGTAGGNDNAPPVTTTSSSAHKLSLSSVTPGRARSRPTSDAYGAPVLRDQGSQRSHVMAIGVLQGMSRDIYLCNVHDGRILHSPHPLPHPLREVLMAKVSSKNRLATSSISVALQRLGPSQDRGAKAP